MHKEAFLTSFTAFQGLFFRWGWLFSIVFFCLVWFVYESGLYYFLSLTVLLTQEKKRSCFEVRSSSFRHWTCLKNENGAGRDEKKNKNKETVSVNKSNHKSKGFRNGSNTLTLFLGWIKLNLFLFLFWTYLFLLYIFYCILFCFWFQFYAVTFRTFVRFETIARKIWTIFLPQGHLEK